MKKYLILVFSAISVFCFSQEKNSALKVFIDCQTGCDYQYIRGEIKSVDFMLDRLAADVHVLITSQRTGSGGNNVKLIFYGQNEFRNLKDTLQFSQQATVTNFERREMLARYIRLGLVPFMLKAGQADRIAIPTVNKEDVKDGGDQMADDPWNYWVMRLGSNGYVRLDQVYEEYRFSGNFNISHVTNEFKVRFNFRAGEDISKVTTKDSIGQKSIRTVKNQDLSFYHSIVKSLGPHWSYGYEYSLANSTFSNIEMRNYFSPGIEYSFFPYSDVNTRFLTFRYGVDVRNNQYYDTTIFNKIQETLLGHKAELSLSLNQKWGTINSGIQYRGLFKDWGLYNVAVNSGFDVRVTGGLSFNLDFSVGIIHDQLSLPKGGATAEEVLMRQRQMASTYRITSWFGVNYRFGSKYNNFINPRFD